MALHPQVVTLLEKMATSFGMAATKKGLTFRVVPSSLFVRSDPVLLERILLNLVANAIRYTTRDGRVLLGCRRSGSDLDIEVWDDPNILVQGRDPQVERAVEEVMRLLETNPGVMTTAPPLEDRSARGMRGNR